MNIIIEKVRQTLIGAADEKTRLSGERFFKEEVKIYGVASASAQRFSRDFFKEVKDLPKDEILALCEEFWKSGYMEESFVACHWSDLIHDRLVREDFATLERWVSLYVSNWASCDTLCNHTVGGFIDMYPEYLGELKRWAKSSNRWVKRASAVSLVIPARNGRYLGDIFEIADILLLDGDDLVQKGYGWMLKAASQAHQNEVFEYVVRNKGVMPRTALRYAIEKMPGELKVIAMSK
ncbi:MAG: DNA alkylation repair protein [Rikenellaceae bacterium]|nr:DNA alkylation repair protein [Rikenellaceae bacterium]